MTTGRINQVTILTGGRRPPRGRQAPDGTPGASPGQSSSLGRGARRQPGPRQQGRRTRGLEADGCQRAIHLPPLSSPRCGPPQSADRANRPLTDCDMRTSEEGYRKPVTPEGGYRPGLTPECLGENDSHRPTIHRPQHCR